MSGPSGLKRLVSPRRCRVQVTEVDKKSAHEKRTITLADHPTSQRKLPLEFPPFSRHTLMQPLWKSQDLSGRINVVLSEQLICRNSGSQEPELGATNDIVCFSFQHAPKGMQVLPVIQI
jgi:hypothetical protein